MNKKRVARPKKACDGTSKWLRVSREIAKTIDVSYFSLSWTGGSFGLLEESHTELWKDVAMGTNSKRASSKRLMSTGGNTNMYGATMGHCPRMQLVSQTGITWMNMDKMRRDIPTQFIGEHQTEYGAREFHRSRWNINGVGGVPDIGENAMKRRIRHGYTRSHPIRKHVWSNFVHHCIDFGHPTTVSIFCYEERCNHVQTNQNALAVYFNIASIFLFL